MSVTIYKRSRLGIMCFEICFISLSVILILSIVI